MPSFLKKKEYVILFGVAVLLFVLDRLGKNLALAQNITPSGGFFEFALFKNTGIAFSIPVAGIVFWPVVLAVFVGLVSLMVKEWSTRPILSASVFMILLGGVSNTYDRLAFGATIDYLIFFGRSAVNIADGMILTGILLAILSSKEVKSVTSNAESPTIHS